ncbi:MAG: 50S ribosomal protein L11 methyltransferase [Dongiaceae bacterium]
MTRRPRARLWQIRFEIAAGAAQAIVGADAILEPFALSLSRFEAAKGRRWRFEALLEGAPPEPLIAALAAATGLPAARFHAAPLPERDWVAESQAKLPALRAGRFFLHGSHFRGRIPKASLPLVIDAGIAFGTGRHETTKACLLALDGLAGRRFRNPLDLGCGTGVLALAMARFWGAKVLAADNDPDAVKVARENAARNGLSALVRAVRSEGYAAAALRQRAPFDLIAANILADPLIEMAPALVRHLAPGGRAILSGLLIAQEPAVLEAHRALGLRLERRHRLGDWSALLLRRPTDR